VTLLVLLGACLRPAPAPDVGDCAAYPSGVYEYGEIGIGTCLSGPADVAFVGDRLLVSNANPWGDFTGGSVLSLDLAALPMDGDKHLVGELDPVAVDLPSFNGPMAWAEDQDLLLVTNKYSEDSRTRESADAVWFVDVSDPASPTLAEDVGEDGATTTVGADPTAVSYDAATSLAYVVNRTDHSVSVLDTSSQPVEVVPPGGPARVLGTTFEDVDASGSHASFVTLEPEDTDSLTANAWTLNWSVGAVRAWIPSIGGAYRVNGNGEDGWRRSNLDLDLDVSVSDGLVEEVQDPWFVAYDATSGATVGRMLFTSGGEIHAAVEDAVFEDWSFEEETLLTPDAASWDAIIGGPAAVVSEGAWYLFYDGGDGQTQSIGLGISYDGVDFARADAPVLAGDGVSYEDPYVVYDSQADRWRMWFSVIDGTSWSIGEAWSDDLLTWTDTGTRWSPGATGAAGPAVQYYGGRFHLFYDTQGLEQGVWEATSVDGTHWEAQGLAFDVASPHTGDPRRIGLFALNEGAFYLSDTAGDVLSVPVSPGNAITDPYNGFTVRIAAGQWLDPEDVGSRADAGVQLDAVAGDLTYFSFTEDDGGGSIGVGDLVGRGFEVSPTPALDPGAAGDWDAERVSSAVVTEIGGADVMYYGGTANGVTSIGRATSSDGRTWRADPDPVLSPEADWESVGMFPSSITVGDDGLLHLYYSAWDGGTWRVGEATSEDGTTFTRIAGPTDSWVFDGGAPGEWDDSGVRDAYVVWDGDAGVDRMWFAGTTGETWQLGYAERVPGEDWVESGDLTETPRPILEAGPGGFGAGGLVRPVMVEEDGVDVLWYAGLDDEVPRVARAVLGDPDRAWKDLNYPSLADTWGFSVVPENDEEAIQLTAELDGSSFYASGCASLANDVARGFLYVGCKLTPALFVLDVRDDSSGDFQDLNYLDVESVALFEGTTVANGGARGLLFDPVHDWLWFLNDSPESAMAVDLTLLEDDADVESTRNAIVAMVPLPRAGESDEGADTQATIGPGELALHPDGTHVFVTNFNANSVSAYDLSLGAPATLVAEATGIGENPYAVRVSPDGRYVVVANYSGEVEQAKVGSTLVVLDGDAASPTFLQPLAWIGNR
jgi:predicted GH43/DUF377 family glycosyl hydrolase